MHTNDENPRSRRPQNNVVSSLVIASILGALFQKFVVHSTYEGILSGFGKLGVGKDDADLLVSVCVILITSALFVIQRVRVARMDPGYKWALVSALLAVVLVYGWNFLAASLMNDRNAFLTYVLLVEWSAATWMIYATVRLLLLKIRAGHLEQFANRAIWFVYEAGNDALNRAVYSSKDSEEDFHRSCEAEIERLLHACVHFVHLVKDPHSDIGTVWASTYFIAKDKFIRHLPKNLDPGMDELDSRTRMLARKGLLEWVLDEKATREYNAKKHRPWKSEYAGFVLAEKLVDDGETNWLPAKSAVAVKLSVNNELIGVLVIASSNENVFAEQDVFPLATIGHYVATIYGHTSAFCIWHRLGWREAKPPALPGIVRKVLKFAPLSYDIEKNPDAFDHVRLWDGSPVRTIEQILKRYREKFLEVHSNADAIEEVYLVGDFNGWKPDHLALCKEPDGVWRLPLNLPRGYYFYVFRVVYRNNGNQKEVEVFDLNTTVRLSGNKKRLSSLVQLA